MIGFSKEWDVIYHKGQQLTIWPWSDVVSLLHRYCKDAIMQEGKVLELGCGAGPNIPFFQSLKLDYYGIEGSATAVNILHLKYPELKDKVMVDDFTKIKCFKDIPDVDIIIDRAAVTHNNSSAIQNTLKNCHKRLKYGGYFIGIDWFSTKHSDSQLGVESGDKNTRINIESGQFENVGNVHFSDEIHLRSLFSEYEIISLEEKIVNRYKPQNNHQFASWNIVARGK